MGLKKVFKDFGVIGFSKILLRISSIVLLPVLTKNLGASGYGLWVQAMATIRIGLPIIRLGLPYSMVRIFPGKNSEEISKDFYSIVTLIALISGFVSIIFFWFPSILAELIFEGEELTVRLLALILFFWSLDKVFMNVFRAFREMKTYGILNVIRRYSEVGLAIVFVVSLGYGVEGALISYLIIRILLFLVLIILISRKISFSFPNLLRTKKYLEFGIPTIPSALSHWVVSTSDRYLIGFFLGSSFVGYYSPGYTLGKMVPWMIAGTLGFILTSNLSKFYEDGELDKVKKIMDLSIRFFFMISLPYFFGAIILGEELLRILSTPMIAKEGSIIVPFTAFTGLIWGVYVIIGHFIILKKKTKYTSMIWFIASIINFTGNIILIPKIGIIGAAITTIISYTIALLITLYVSFKKLEFDLKINYKPIAKSLLSSIIMASIVLSLKIYVSINPLILVLVGVITYFGILWLIGGISEKEINFLRNQISRS